VTEVELLAALADERAAHAKARDLAEGYRLLYEERGVDLLAQVEQKRRFQRSARRYRQAWMNARQRAAAFNDALADANKERETLHAEIAMWASRYAEVCTAMREMVP
jgi:hypothetical protein